MKRDGTDRKIIASIELAFIGGFFTFLFVLLYVIIDGLAITKESSEWLPAFREFRNDNTDLAFGWASFGSTFVFMVTNH